MFNKIRDAALKGVVKADLAFAETLERGLDKLGEKGARRVRAASNLMVLTGVGLMAVSDVALAAGANYGVGAWVKNLVNDTGVPVLDGARWGFYGIGAVGVGTGVNKFVQMSKQQSQVQPKEAFSYVGGGGALMGLGYLSDLAYQSMTTNQGGAAQAVRTL